MVTFTTDLGSVGSNTVNKPTVDGVATATLDADEGPGVAHLTAVLDIETTHDEVTINQPPYTPTPIESGTDTATPTGSPTPTSSASVTPTETASVTPTPTTTATPSPSPSPTPSGLALKWGDSDSDSDGTTRDNQALLRKVLDQNALSQTEPCPDIGSPATG